MLGLGMEEMDEEEDEKIEVQGVPFVADGSFLHKYGRNFDISFNQNKQVVLSTLDSDAFREAMRNHHEDQGEIQCSL